MLITNAADMPVSETQLRALYSLLPEVLKENIYGPKFSKRLQACRESLHPCGKTDIRKLDGFDGLTVQVNLGDRLGCDLYYGFFQEYYDYNLFMALLKPKEIVVDIGSNFGMYTLGAAKRIGPKGKVVACEPDVRSMSLLKENIRLNTFEGIVTCLEVCIGGYDGEVAFYAAAEPSFSGIHNTHRSETVDHLTLPIRRLDSALNEQRIKRVDKIKIDVEGAEYQVLEGAMGILAKSDAVVMLEISSKNLDNDRGEKLSATLGRLQSQGYVCFMIDSDVSPAKLIFNNSLKGIVQKLRGGQTRNYFLARRDGEQFNLIQDAFKLVNLDAAMLHKEISLRPHSFLGRNEGECGQQSILVQTATDNLFDLHARVWADGIEKQVAIDSCRHLIAQFHALESELAKAKKALDDRSEENKLLMAKLTTVNEELDCRSEKNKLLMAKLTTVNEELDCRSEKNKLLMGKLVQASKELAAKAEEKAAFKAKLIQTSKELAASSEGKAAFKAKLVQASKELAAKTEEIDALKYRLAQAGKELAIKAEENALLIEMQESNRDARIK